MGVSNATIDTDSGVATLRARPPASYHLMLEEAFWVPRLFASRSNIDRVPVSGVTGRGRRDLRQGRVDQAATAGSLTIGSSLKGAIVSRLM